MVPPAFDEGLSTAQAAQRLRQDGPNALPGEQRRGLRAIARETLQEPMFMLLLAAGALYLVLGDLQEGLILFGLVLVVLALTLYQEGRTEHALQSLRELTSPRALVNKGGILIQMKQFDTALAPLNKLIELQPNHPGAHLNRALALMNLNRLDDAAKDYRRLLELAPTTPNGHFGLAEIAWQRKQTTDAKKHYEAGLKLASTNAPEAKLAQQRLKELSGGK